MDRGEACGRITGPLAWRCDRSRHESSKASACHSRWIHAAKEYAWGLLEDELLKRQQEVRQTGELCENIREGLIDLLLEERRKGHHALVIQVAISSRFRNDHLVQVGYLRLPTIQRYMSDIRGLSGNFQLCSLIISSDFIAGDRIKAAVAIVQ